MKRLRSNTNWPWKTPALRAVASVVSGAMILAVALAGVAFSPATTAYAAPPAQTPEPPGEFRQLALEYALLREQHALEGLALRIDFANEVADKTQNWIDLLQGQGKDTAALEAALAKYEAGIDAAQASWDTADSILSNPAGFDAEGHVTDVDQARETLRQGADALRKTNRLLVDAGIAFRRAVKDFRWANAGST